MQDAALQPTLLVMIVSKSCFMSLLIDISTGLGVTLEYYDQEGGKMMLLRWLSLSKLR